MKFRTTVLVLLYNKEISDSMTLNAILESSLNYVGHQLVIWNNGPKYLNCVEVSGFLNLGFSVSIRETLDNVALSEIYNTVIDEFDSSYYVILDDDSTLTSDYLAVIKSCDADDIFVPVIECNGRCYSPQVNGRAYNGSNSSADMRVVAITSGIIISKTMSSRIKDVYGQVFDENFVFYGVDSTFFDRVYDAGLSNSIRIVPGFEHGLSSFENESIDKKKWRAKEYSISETLRLKYYCHDGVCLKLCRFVLRVLKSISLTIMRDPNARYPFVMIKTYLVGAHPRSKNYKSWW
jgi:hypothetical protein